MDYISHPAEIVDSGKPEKALGIKELRAAIPDHCFRPSYITSFRYLSTDLMHMGMLIVMALSSTSTIEGPFQRFVAWMVYGFLQGCVLTGLWVLGHECGHSAFSSNDKVNDFVGFILHTALMTPYFSWKSSHRRHHIWANHMQNDFHYVPPEREMYALSMSVEPSRVEELTEDAPLATLSRIILQQVIGWPWYLLCNNTAGPKCLQRQKSTNPLANNHINPNSPLFRKDEMRIILVSDIGLLSMASVLFWLGKHFGWSTMFFLYFVPYLWLNNWIIAITYLHHIHPDIPRYQPEAWTFIKGATATIDREFGWIGKHLFHGIIEFHVIHHLFSRIPFYHAEEATKAIIPLLGTKYHAEKQRYFFWGMWEAFTKCQWVEPDGAPLAKDQAMRYRGGPCPPPEVGMGVRKWLAWS